MTIRRRTNKPDGFALAALAALLFAIGAWMRLHLPLDPPADPSLAGGMTGIASDFSWLSIALAATSVACAMSAFGVLGNSKGRAPQSPENFAAAAIVAVTMAAFAIQAWHRKSAVIDGARIFWLDDDMMISMRYARNLAAGYGLAWNPGGARIEGFTNFLWTLAMALPHLFLAPVRTAAFMLALSAGLLAAILLLAWKLGAALGLRPAERLFALILLALNRWLFYWSLGGSEGTLQAALMLLGALAILKSKKHRPLSWSTGLVLGLMGIVRADAPLVGGVFLLIWIALIPSRRASRFAWLPIVLFPLALAMWRRSYFGEWFPNTYYLRMLGTPHRAAAGSYYFLRFVSQAGGLVALALLQAAIGRGARGRWLAAVPVSILLYAIYVGGDELPEFRFYAPAMPLLVFLAVAGASRAINLAASRRTPAFRLAALTLVLSASGFMSLLLPYQFRELGIVRAWEERNNVEIGLLLKQHTRPGALIAHSWAGAAPYFSERPGLDMLGKMDAHIAHLPAAEDDLQTAHNKYDAAYDFSKRPDVVVAGISARTAQDRAAFETSPYRLSYPGIFRVLENPVFDRDYLANSAANPLSDDFHGIFIRSDTSLADPPAAWAEPKP